MTWVGLTDLNIAAFDPDGVGAGSNFPFEAVTDGILPVGTLMIEAIFVAQHRMPQRVLRYERMQGWSRGVTVTMSAEGAVLVEMRQGDVVSKAILNITAPPRETRLRISYSWDAPGRRALLTVENLDQALLYQAEFPNPIPLPIEDAAEVILNGRATRIGRETRVIALSDKVEPVGLTAGVVKGTPVETPSGPKFVERLRLGDMVTTSDGEASPVRWVVRREVPALGRFRPVRIRAPYFGLTRDILCAPDHRVMVTGAEAEYLFDESQVLVEAMHLTGQNAVHRERPIEKTLWYYHVLLDGHECLNYAGLWGESLFVGAIGRSAELIATTALADMPFSAIPRHTRFALPILSGFEAQTLAQSLRA